MSETVIRAAVEPGDLGWVVMAHGELYAAEFGWGSEFEQLVAGIVADYAASHDPQYEAAWIAELDGERVGSIFCVRGPDDGTAKLRLLLLDPAARGHGLGAQLVDTCLAFARSAGYKRMVLWTTDRQVAAGQIYLARGFRLTGDELDERFADGVLSQYYELDLTD
ncbi:acetyltransferase (GNAT) family protein [Kribbella voronezhensis]|uniref:Acetyltransferase (GNAT) family protein n=1 Tax=Kribbella voronezhensis TaxID=2512212 RepID=A0A4R7T6S1_9ACTN|nr:GNAT family N-acetyltransferase [Kribbella voronezhensis]TDU87289.1 acetyltransferase (GNAT) family protein [Kribbella voronezhensis]